MSNNKAEFCIIKQRITRQNQMLLYIKENCSNQILEISPLSLYSNEELLKKFSLADIKSVIYAVCLEKLYMEKKQIKRLKMLRK